MATVRSLGIREPTALPYLIAESILPADPPREAYRWHTYLTKAGNAPDLVEEEVVIADACVVWSKCGVIKRVLNLSIEDEPVLQAFTTFFPADDTEAREQARWYEEALVVVLRTQVHILLLSGDSHVLPVAFETESAFACPNGFLLQRKVSESDHDAERSPPTFNHDLSTINESQGTIRSSGVHPSLLLPDTARDSSRSTQRGDGMPRTFSCVETMSEMGLVVFGSADKAQSLEDCQALPTSETLLYMSRYDELQASSDDQEPLCIAVTHDAAKGVVTIWHVAGEVPISTRAKSKSHKQNRESTTTRRKSSNIYGRIQNMVAPAPREPHPLRMSFSGLAQTFADNTVHPSAADSKAAGNDELASHLGPEFEHMGVQTRSARRVSSMLARTDLGTGNDRNTFHDLAVGHNTRKSVGRGTHRGESIGSFSDRQSFGIRRRSSFLAPASAFSTGTSFLDIPGRGRMDDVDLPNQTDTFPDESGQATDLRRDVGFFQLTSIPVASGYPISQGPRLKVLALAAPFSCSNETTTLSVCVLDKSAEQVAIIDIDVQSVTAIRRQQLSKKIKLRLGSVRRGSAVSDIGLVRDGPIQRLLVFSKTRSGEPLLHLEAPWSSSFRLSLPSSFLLSSPFDAKVRGTPTKPKDEVTHRAVPASSIELSSVSGEGYHGKIALLDTSRIAHAVHIQLAPKDAYVQQVVSLCNFVFGKGFQDAMLVALWEVQRWLREREEQTVPEWSAMVVCLFTLAVPFVDDKQAKSGTPARRKRGLLRSASGTAVDLSDFNAMNEAHTKLTGFNRESYGWQWLLVEEQSPPVLASPRSPRHVRNHSQAARDDLNEKKDPFILQCIGWAREFVQSPAGEAAIGPEGYLPISINKDRDVRQTALAKALIGLHLLYEEQKLIPVSDRSGAAFDSFPGVLSQLGIWLGWESWTMRDTGYYVNEATFTDRWLLEESKMNGLDHPQQPFTPPSILETLCRSIAGHVDHEYPSLNFITPNKQNATSDDVSPAALLLTPRTQALLSMLKSSADWTKPRDVLEHLRERSGKAEPFISIPDGFAVVFRQALAATRIRNPELLDNNHATESVTPLQPRGTSLAGHRANKDYHTANLTAFDVDTLGLGRWDMSWESDRVLLTRRIFHDDRRYREAIRLVDQTRPPVVECNPEPGWSEADLLEAQKDLTQLVARRTLSVAAGRAMLRFSSREPLLTERVPISAFSLQCLITSRTASDSIQPMTFSADKSSFTEEKVCWAFFHNGASSGLTISRDAKCVDTSWILYNKPQELTNRHAGFLLALGLNGHLKTLAKWVAFKYLTPKHTMTSIGLLLGLSASYLGTQDQLITRLLSVHVTRLLPPGAAELNLSPLTQTTGIMGIGLLYLSSQHRRMSEVMLSEIENNDSEEGSPEEQVLRDEGYRLAAGFSLGLINLGEGDKLHGLKEMSVPERLLAIAVGTKNVNLVHVLDRATAGAVMATALMFMKTNNVSIARKIDIPDTIHQFDYVRPDIFLLRTLARHLIMWDIIQPTKEFIAASLPAAYRRRASLDKTKHLATEDMPFFNILAGICFALGLRFAGSQRPEVRDLLVGYLDHFLRLSRLPCPHYDARVTLNSVRNCLDVVALASATVMAGSGDLIVMRRLRSLHGRVDKDTPFGSHMAAHMALGALFLGSGTMTFGTSNLAVASLCIAFYPLFPSDVLDNKAHLQALRHLWVLAVEGRCLVCREREGGALVGGVDATVQLKNGPAVIIRSPGLLPEFDSIAHIKIDAEGWWPVSLDLSDDDPSVLAKIKKDGAVNICLARQAHFARPVVHKAEDLLAEEMRVLDEQSMRGVGGVPSANPNKAARTHPDARAGEENPFDWLFELDGLSGLEGKERELVVGGVAAVGGGSGSGSAKGRGRELLEETPVDARLRVERGLLPSPSSEEAGQGLAGGVGVMSRARLWEVRALLEWFDRFDREDEELEDRPNEDGQDAGDGEREGREEMRVEKEVKWRDGLWLRREVVEGLREKVWAMMMGGVEGEGDGEGEG